MQRSMDLRHADRCRHMRYQHRAHDLRHDDEQSLRQQLSRLRKAIDPFNVSLGVPLGNDTFIETKERAGYRLNPELRELSLSDIADELKDTLHPDHERLVQSLSTVLGSDRL